jgi:hypothetical protein
MRKSLVVFCVLLFFCCCCLFLYTFDGGNEVDDPLSIEALSVYETYSGEAVVTYPSGTFQADYVVQKDEAGKRHILIHAIELSPDVQKGK